MFAKFQNINEFNEWHEQVKLVLGIPDGLGTIEYTMPWIKDDGTLIARVNNRIDTSGLDLITEAEGIEQGYLPSIEPKVN